jgi:LPXTG-site transpeptidase (sortase) family protein
VIGLPRKRRVRLTRQSCLMLAAELIVLILAIWRLGIVVFPSSDDDGNPTRSLPTNLSQGLTFADALPTLTPDASVPQRIIAFPGASISAPIVPAGRVQGTWETRHLGESVGHLVGTSWLNGAGGNIVLAGHVESATGAPGPFAHLFEAEVGDLVILREGLQEKHFVVTLIDYAEPTDVSYVAQDGRERVTLITCTDWDHEVKTYLGRLVVVAEPAVITAQNR